MDELVNNGFSKQISGMEMTLVKVGSQAYDN